MHSHSSPCLKAGASWELSGENVLRGARTKVSDELAASLHARWRAGERSVDLAAEAGTHRTNLLKRFRRIDAAASLATPTPDGMLF